MIWWALVASGALLGAALKRWIWTHSFGGVFGWFKRRWFHVKQKYKRWKFKRQMR